MKRFIIGMIVGLLVGGGLGYGAGIIHFPYLFPPPEVNEVVTGKTDADVVGHSAFIHANPSDPVHYGRGSATLYENLLHLEDDFEVGPGPKYHVYLVQSATITPDTDVEATKFVDLGRLKAFSGSQNYIVPAGLNLTDYQFVVIWCEQFKVLISPAAIVHRS